VVRRFAQSLALAMSLGAVAALAAPAAAVPEQTTHRVSVSKGLEVQLLAEMNRIRARHALRPLRLSRELGTAALAHSEEMGRRGFFDHSSADGSAFWRRIQRYYASGGYGYWAVGENLLWSSPRVDARNAVRMWLESPPHRKNLLAPRWLEVGLSAVHFVQAPGVFRGLEVTIVTADFGHRRSS